MDSAHGPMLSGLCACGVSIYGRQKKCERCAKKARSIARRERDECLRSLGLVKVRGAVSGKIYWE